MSDPFTPIMFSLLMLHIYLNIRRNWKCMKQITPIDPFFLDLTDD